MDGRLSWKVLGGKETMVAGRGGLGVCGCGLASPLRGLGFTWAGGLGQVAGSSALPPCRLLPPASCLLPSVPRKRFLFPGVFLLLLELGSAQSSLPQESPS